MVKAHNPRKEGHFKGAKGTGSRFEDCLHHVKGRDPKAICASIGRKKYGKAGMTRMSAHGRKH